MILRRIAQSIRSRDWFTLSIEFAIVVAGVFLGIQMANWNEARSDRVLERVMLESLQRDFENIVRGDVERYERTIAAPDHLAALINAIRSGEEPARSIVWPGVEAALVAYAATPPSPTYGELLATGRLSRLTNASLRRALAEFDRSRLNEDGMLVFLVELSYGSPLYAHVDLDSSDIGLGISGTYRWEGLTQTLPYLQERILWTSALANWRRNSRQHAEQILELIESELK